MNKKIELHLHLDGSIRPATVAELLNMDIEDVKKELMVSSDNVDLTEYLTKFFLPGKVMQTKENLTRVTKELVEDLKNDGIIYAEIRFASNKHTYGGLTLDEIVSSVIEGTKLEGIKINIILCMMRGDTFADNMKVIEVAEKFLKKGVVAVDLAGDESCFKTITYESLFDCAKEKNIPFTIHAGEADSVESIMAALNFGAKRIGHGIKCLESNECLEKLKKNNVTLEICPTSNVQTKAVNTYQEHPIKKLDDIGILITINTDNNTVSNITLSQEYQKLRDTFGFNDFDFKKFNLNAVKASFMTEEEKQEYIKLMENMEV